MRVTRRIARRLAPLCFVWSAMAQPASWPANARDFRVHMIGQAHIDPVWLWPWPEGLSVIHSTLRSALDRMNETPDFEFTASSGQFYEWVEQNDPEMIAQIRKRIEEARWGIAGGWWVEPDVNMPSGEALVRQGLCAQKPFERLFGRTAKVAYNPDSFGHAGTLPQILKLQGMQEYVFMRPMPREKSLPADIFWWQAPDGTRVLTYRIPYSYNDEGSVRERINRILDLKEPIRTMMAFYGAGDHGGGATKENIRSIQEIQSQPGAPVLVYSTPERYFAEIGSRNLPTLPTVQDDLQHDWVGCYTAESAIKKLNRTTELDLVTAEKIASIGSAVWGAAYPKDWFTAAWKRLLFLQFHDSLAGTSLPEHYQTTVPQGYGFAADVANQAMYLAAQKLAWDVPATNPDSKYLVVFNPHAWPVKGRVEYDIGYPAEAPLIVEDEAGKPVAHQAAPASAEVNGRQRVVLEVPLPAFGYWQVRFRKGDRQTVTTTLKTDANTIENEHLRLIVASNGAVSVFDKDANTTSFTNGRALVMDRVGVSCGGPFNSATGVVQAPPNLSTWVDIPITRILGDTFGVPCALENDANAGAVAEHRFGAGVGTRNMVFLTMGTGLGAGIITDGQLYRGTCDAAGEIGHVRLTRAGPVGYHKSGSVEGWASGGGLAQLASTAIARTARRGETTVLGNGPVSAKDGAEAARAGDRLAQRLVRATGKRLGETLAILVDILNPERIVIGGLAMRMGDNLLEPARATMRREALPGSVAVCEVVPAKLNEQIGDLAALCVAMGI